MQSWPIELPPPDVSFNGSNETAVVRTNMDSGRYRQRQRFTKSVNICAVSFTISSLEFEIFKDFFENKISQGADWFEIELHLGLVEKKRFYFRFTGGYRFSYLPLDYWRITGTVEMDEDVSDNALMTLDGVDSAYIADKTLISETGSMELRIQLTKPYDPLVTYDTVIYDDLYNTNCSFIHRQNGQLTLYRDSVRADCTTNLPQENLEKRWLRVVQNFEESTISFYHSEVEGNWISLGENIAYSTPGRPYAGVAKTGLLTVTTDPPFLSGQIHKLKYYAGADSSNLTLFVDFQNAPPTPALGSFICDTGQEITLLGNATISPT